MAKEEEREDGVSTLSAPSPDVHIMEKGDVYFMYRPKVDVDVPHNIDDIQRVYLVLRVHGTSSDAAATAAPEDVGEDQKGKAQRKNGDGAAEGEHGESHLRQPENKKVKMEVKEEEDAEAADANVPGRKSGILAEGAGKKGDTEEQGDERAAKRPKAEPDVAADEDKQEGKEGREKGELLRLIILGRKRLPDPSKRSRPFWGFVEAVTLSLEDIAARLGPEDYETKTRGHRHVGAARAVAGGEYAIVRHARKTKTGRTSRPDTHFVYKAECYPAKEHEPQDELNIKPEASYVIQVKNPTQPSPPYASRGMSQKKAEFPKALLEKMGSRRWAPCDPPDFLNYEGCEFILISASDDLEQDLGLEAHVDEEHCTEVLHELLSAAVGLKEEKRMAKPLFEGKWI